MHRRRFNTLEGYDAAAAQLDKSGDRGRSARNDCVCLSRDEYLVVSNKCGLQSAALRLRQEAESKFAFTASRRADKEKARLADNDGSAVKIGSLSVHSRFSRQEAKD